MKPSIVGLVAVVVGFGITIVGLGANQAWWTIAFALGSLAVALLSTGGLAATRLIAVGAALTIAALLAGMSVFLFYGSGWGGTPWLAASIGSLLTSILLIVVARHMYRRGSTAAANTRDIPEH